MSEVSQLNEMNAVLIASKEDNEKKRHEADQMAVKIAELEKQLEEGVAFTNRYRATKTAATGGLRKRWQALDDLFLKLDHVAKQTSDVYVSRISVMAEGVQEQERVAAQGTRDVTAALERFNVLVKRHRECSEQEANAKSLSAANASTEDETKELAARVEELDTLCKVQDEEAAIADAARSATLAATQSRRAERESLEKRLASACTSLQMHTVQIAGVRAEMEAADRSWNDDTAATAKYMESVASQTQTLELRQAELSDDITRQTAGELAKVEAEQATLAQLGPRATMELEEVKRQYKQVHPEVAKMRTQLEEKKQRCQILGDQLAASQKVIIAHSVNQPGFDTRKAEHKELSSSITSLRSARIEAAARKSALDDDIKSKRLETEAAMTETKDEIATIKQDGEGIVAARNEAAACVCATQTTLAKAQEELASVQALSEKALAALENQCRAEQDLQNGTGEKDSGQAEQISRCEHATLEQRVEAESIAQRVENMTTEFEAAKVRAAEERQSRAEAAKQTLLTEVMARKIGAMTAEIEATYAEELKRVQDAIVCEDARLRAACTDASNHTSGGGAEGRLEMDLSDLRAEEAAIRCKVEAAELRVQRFAVEKEETLRFLQPVAATPTYVELTAGFKYSVPTNLYTYIALQLQCQS